MKILIISLFFILFSFLPSIVFAAVDCTALANQDKIECKFGTISPPPALQKFIGTDTTGASGISKFLSNGIALIYSVATVVLLLMVLWGAFEWMTSGGDKEKVAAAQKKIMNAFIGILLFAIAFAVIGVLGIFTGFTFFVGQK